MGKITKADLKKAASKAASKAREKATQIAEKARAGAGRANRALRDMKHRRVMDGVEVVVGGVAAGALHGAGVSVDWGDSMPDVPAGLPAGLVAIGAGVYLDSYDLQSAGLGMVAFGAGRMVEDYTAQSLADAAKK